MRVSFANVGMFYVQTYIKNEEITNRNAFVREIPFDNGNFWKWTLVNLKDCLDCFQLRKYILQIWFENTMDHSESILPELGVVWAVQSCATLIKRTYIWEG